MQDSNLYGITVDFSAMIIFVFILMNPTVRSFYPQKAEVISKKLRRQRADQIFIMRLHESPRPDVTMPFVNRKYFSR